MLWRGMSRGLRGEAAPENGVGRQVAGEAGDAAARPGGRAGPEEPGDRGAVPRVAGERSEEEVLAEMVAAPDAVATDEVRVVRLQIVGCQDRALEDQILDPGCVFGQLRDRAVRIRLRRVGPVAGRDLSGRVAADF